jgi:hypothetical protein
MPYKVSFVVEDQETAELIVEDTKTTDSMCLVKEDSSELEFYVLSIESEEVDG